MFNVPHQHMPSNLNYSFAQVPSVNIQRSTFDRSSTYKTTFNAGKLIPIYCDEVYPGDTFQVNANIFARLATPLTPYMDNLWFETFFFFVPNRLVWDNWEKLMGERIDPDDSIDYLTPQIVSPVGGFEFQSVYDYFGIRPKIAGVSFNALPFRGMNLIWNEWFRDQNLQDSLPVHRGDGPDPSGDYTLLSRNKRHDYFTGCLPFAQKGDPVEIPLTGDAPVFSDGTAIQVRAGTGAMTNLTLGSGTIGNPLQNITATGSSATVNFGPDGATNTGLYTDLSAVTAATINSLRQAFQIQKLLERDARGGTRYTEILRAHFGVISPDARLQRPEFLGGGRTSVNVNPIAQTSATTDSTTPLANLAAVGTINANGHSFGKSFVEHGFIIGFGVVYADLTYQQGLPKLWSRRTRYDYYWPEFAHLGEQAVLNKEIFVQGTSADNEVFGYQERWAELRYKPSMITGQFRSDYTESLDVWHLSQDFSSLPVLGSDFITENPPVDRVIAVESESGYPQFLMDIFYRERTTRPLPMFSVPGYIDHF